MKYFYSGVDSSGKHLWRAESGHTIVTDISREGTIVSFCREALHDKFKNKWIDVLYFDAYKEDDFYNEVGIALYTKNVAVCPRSAFAEGPEGDWTYGYEVYTVSHQDMAESIKNGVSPTYIIIKGKIATYDYGDTPKYITSMQEVENIEHEKSPASCYSI